MLRKMRPVLIVGGVALLIGSIVGARNLTGSGGPDAKAKGGDAPRPPSGLVVLGTVDSDPQPVQYGLPPVLQSGTVEKVYVKEGDEVKEGQKLYEFDATIPKAKLESAKAAVNYANSRVTEAEQLVAQHKAALKLADVGITAAKRKVEIAYRTLYFVDKELEKSYAGLGHPKEKWAELKLSSLDLVKATADHNIAKTEQEVAEAKLEQLTATDPSVKKTEAAAAVKQAEAAQKEAAAAVELCVVKAKTAGTVEHVSVGAGATLGVSTRTPALWLIPTGARVVRAEVEAEFAHRVGPELVGKTVTVLDHTDAKITYTGVVKRVGTTFLPKRSAGDSLLGSDTRVLPVDIEVADYAPQGKPPLFVGKRVRVSLGP
jgi:multidrug resistance efflux pump